MTFEGEFKNGRVDGFGKFHLSGMVIWCNMDESTPP